MRILCVIVGLLVVSTACGSSSKGGKKDAGGGNDAMVMDMGTSTDSATDGNAMTTPCSPNPCENGAACSVDGDDYTCDCVDGFWGDDCESACTTDGTNCATVPGCNQADGKVTACTECKPGYEGDLCEDLIATSCLHWLLLGEKTDGAYPIDPSGGDDADAFDVYCDQTTDGGGWMKVLHYEDDAYTPTNAASGTVASATISGFAKLADAQINSWGGLRTFRMTGNTEPSFFGSASTFDDTVVAWGLMKDGQNPTCQASDLDSCASFFDASSTYIDTLSWGISNQANRYLADTPGNAVNCINPSALGKRCVSTGDGNTLIEDFELWMRETGLGTVAYYPFEEGAGAVVNDWSGNGNHATAGAGNTWPSNGVLGGAFSGTASTDMALPNLSEFSIALWAKRTGIGPAYSRLIGWDAFQMEIASNQEALYVYNGTWDATTANLVQDDWHFVVVTYNGTTRTVWFDGNTTISDDINESLTGKMYIGQKHSGGESFVGEVDDVRVFRRALTLSEVSALYAEAE